MGKPNQVTGYPQGREPGELKHLSNPRKRKDSASSGERKRSSPNRSSERGCRGYGIEGVRKPNGLGRPARAGESPVGAQDTGEVSS